MMNNFGDLARRGLADEVSASLAAGRDIDTSILALVAHPDDETIGLGARLNCLHDLMLITATDGAPLDMADAASAGFATADAYALARKHEQAKALAALGARPRQACWEITDQACVDHIIDMAQRLEAALADRALVVTHAYEGGHPDHDACAMAVQLACSALGADAPVRLEFASYHQADGAMVSQHFWGDPDAPEIEALLSNADRARKAAAFAAYASQAHVMTHFSPAREAYRLAPIYDFTRPPPPGVCLYDGFGFDLTSEGWRQTAQVAVAQR